MHPRHSHSSLHHTMLCLQAFCGFSFIHSAYFGANPSGRTLNSFAVLNRRGFTFTLSSTPPSSLGTLLAISASAIFAHKGRSSPKFK
ncbi:hypothetical protein E4T56_gene6320 [Termitomyces sp. T112]|nr:hypothetical protein E4T56_gene6320 [Termitomyces sp. T112]